MISITCLIIISIFIIVLTILYLFYKYLTSNYNYWSKRGISGPWPVPVLGTLIYYLLDYRHIVDVKWYQKFGKIYGKYDGNKPVLCLTDPALIKQILVKDFHIFKDRTVEMNRHSIVDRSVVVLNGDDWKRIRSIMTGTLTSGKMKRMLPMIRDCLKDFMSALESQSRDGKGVDVMKLYGHYNMDVISTCAFATKIDLYNNPNHPFVSQSMEGFKTNYMAFILNLTLPTFVLKYLKIYGNFLLIDVVCEYFFEIIRGIIKERKSNNKSYNDFIDLMLNYEKKEGIVRDVNDINESHHVNEGEEELKIEEKTHSGVEKYITEDEIIANANAFHLAGYLTTTTIISYCTLELALHTDIQEKLYSEIMSSVDSNGEIDYDLLMKLPYLDAVISETLRLHTPGPGLLRVASKDYQLGDTGIKLAKGQIVQMSAFIIHRCEEYYPNADQFIPERFLPENRHKIIPYTYLPFGGGPHHCLGMRFALMITKLALVHVFQQYMITTPNNRPVLLSNSLLFRSPQSIFLSMDKRN